MVGAWCKWCKTSAHLRGKFTGRRNGLWILCHFVAAAGFNDGLVDTWQCWLQTLVAAEDAELYALVVGEVFQAQTAEQVVHDGRCNANVWIVGHACWFEAHVGECFNECTKWNSVLQAVADALGKGVHDA